MVGYRPERVAEMIHKELAVRLRTEIKDHRMVPLSITHVKVTRDLSRATVEYLPLGGGDPSDELQEALVDVAKQLRGPIGRALRLRHAPELVFTVDTHTATAFRVTRLIGELSAERGEGSEGQDLDDDGVDADDDRDPDDEIDDGDPDADDGVAEEA